MNNKYKIEIVNGQKTIQGTVDLVDLDLNLIELPNLSDVVITGSFFCSYNNLTTLQGAPQSVGGNFHCSNNKLTTLQGAPKYVKGSFYCNNNKLTSLQGAPKSIKGSFFCSYNNLTSLQGAPESVKGDFYCTHNKLTTLQGAPKSIEGKFYCHQFSGEDYRKYIADMEILESMDIEAKELFAEMIATL